MATKKKSGGTKPKKAAKWAKNTKDYETKQSSKAKGGKKGANFNSEDAQIIKQKSKRIRDVGQKPPKGYHRTGGMYFAKNANDRPIKSMTTEAQQQLFYANKPKFIGVGKKDVWVAQAANQGMYNGDTGEANFRKSAAARKLIDADGGTYAPDYQIAGAKKAKKSRYIMAIGQDGHAR
jgi:hypothetical protein